MGAPVSKIEATEEKTAEELLSAFKQMAPAERRKHASVYNYWLSIRRGGNLPPIRDLDALEISDAAPSGVLLELVDGGQDAEILHCGETLRGDVHVKKVSEAPDPSVLSCIGCKLGIIAISRDALAFEDHFLGPDGTTRCCVTLLPFSMTGEAVDFVYGLVSVETGVTFAADEPEPEPVAEETTSPVEVEAEPVAEIAPDDEEPVVESEPETVETLELGADDTVEPPAETETAPEAVPESQEPAADPNEAEQSAKPGFSKIFDALAGAKGFFGTVASSEPESAAEPGPTAEPELPPIPVAEEEAAPAAEELPPAVEDQAEPWPPLPDDPAFVPKETAATIEEPEPVAEEPAPVAEEAEPVAEEAAPIVEEPAPIIEETIETPVCATEGTLQTKLTEVRSKADEARMARLRSEALMVEGLSAAYDFALDAEEAPEEYLKLVEAQGLKIQLRSPMKPVVKLAFDGYCDEGTIKELEAVLAWALKSDLPRGSLAARIEEEGGIEAIANGGKTRRSTDA